MLALGSGMKSSPFYATINNLNVSFPLGVTNVCVDENPVAFTVGKYDNCFIESFSAMQCVSFDVECKFGDNTKFVYYIINIKIKESERAENC